MDDNLILRALMGAAGASVLAEIDLEKKRQEAEDLRKDRDAARAENETLRGAMAADDKRLRDAEKRVWSGGTWGCDAPDKMADEIVFLRQRLADAEHPPAMAQQRDEISYLRARLDEERSVSARLREQLDAARAEVETLREQLADAQLAVSDAFAEVNSVRQQLDAANAAVTLQRAGIDRLHKFVGAVRLAMWPEDIKSALTELDAGTEPTPVAEPAHCPECERLRAFVGGIDNLLEQDRFDRRDIAELLIVLRSNPSVTITSSPTPVAEPLDAEGGA